MASKALASTALLLSLKILFLITMVSSTNDDVPCPPPPKAPSTSVPSAPTPAKAKASSCPKDTLKIGACVNVLKELDLLHLGVGQPPLSSDCCPLIEGLADLEAAVCLCTTIKLDILGLLELNNPIDLSLILNDCGKNVPSGYKCA